MCLLEAHFGESKDQILVSVTATVKTNQQFYLQHDTFRQYGMMRYLYASLSVDKMIVSLLFI